MIKYYSLLPLYGQELVNIILQILEYSIIIIIIIRMRWILELECVELISSNHNKTHIRSSLLRTKSFVKLHKKRNKKKKKKKKKKSFVNLSIKKQQPQNHHHGQDPDLPLHSLHHFLINLNPYHHRRKKPSLRKSLISS